MADALEVVAKDFLLLEQHADSVGKLQLATGTQLSVFERAKNLRGENVAANDGLIGGRVFHLWLLHQILHAVQATVELRSGLSFYRLAIDHAVLRDSRAVHFI